MKKAESKRTLSLADCSIRIIILFKNGEPNTEELQKVSELLGVPIPDGTQQPSEVEPGMILLFSLSLNSCLIELTATSSHFSKYVQDYSRRHDDMDAD